MTQVLRGASFTADREQRLTLSRWWDRDLPWATICMANPSDADHRRDDPTVRRFVELTMALGFGGFHVVNFDPKVATDPREFRDWWIQNRRDSGSRFSSGAGWG